MNKLALTERKNNFFWGFFLANSLIKKLTNENKEQILTEVCRLANFEGKMQDY